MLARLAPIFVVAVAAWPATPASAVPVSRHDAAATHAYLEALLAERRSEIPAYESGLKNLGELETQVDRECPGVLADVPPPMKGETNLSRLQAAQELLSATFGAVEKPEHPALAHFERTVRRLRWSNHKLTRLLHSLARESAEQSAIPPPNLCSDLKFWVASGYQTVSPATKQFLHRHDVVSSITQIEPEGNEPVGNMFELNKLIAYRLKRYEDRADRLLARKALPETSPSDPRLKPLYEAIGKIYVALGSSPRGFV